MTADMVQKGGSESLVQLLERSADLEAQRFSALALSSLASRVVRVCANVEVPM